MKLLISISFVNVYGQLSRLFTLYVKVVLLVSMLTYAFVKTIIVQFNLLLKLIHIQRRLFESKTKFNYQILYT